MSMLQMGVKEIPYIKSAVNVGMLMDIPTGRPLLGKHGAYYHNGGHTGCITIMGPGNSYKSLITDTINEVACLHISPKFLLSTINKYDTENNTDIPTLEQRLAKITDEDWFDSGRFRVTDATIYHGDEWFKEFKNFIKEKVKMGSKIRCEVPFYDKAGKPIKIFVPTFTNIDSMSRFEVSQIADARDASDIGDGKQNTLAARSNLFKGNLIAELTTLLPESSTYLTTTAHMAEHMSMGQGDVPKKALQHMKLGEKISNVPRGINYLTTAMYQIDNVKTLTQDKDKKLTLYSIKGQKDDSNIEDLNLVTMKMLRSKTGGSGWSISLVVSQKYGVLPALTEFHYLRTLKGYGLGGDISVSGNFKDACCVLMPDTKIAFNSIRSLLESNHRLARAVNICSDLHQMRIFWRDNLDKIDPKLYNTTPEQLYQLIIDQGFDWETILDTRPWYSLAEDTELNQLYLSNTDILRMAHGLYVPYWMEADKKTIKKKYIEVAKQARHISEDISKLTTELEAKVKA